MDTRVRSSLVIVFVVLVMTLVAACTRSNQHAEPQRESGVSTVDTTAQNEQEPPSSANDEAVVETEVCDESVDCDCGTGSIIAGRRESESCCELDCNPDEEITIVSTGDGRRFRCSRCGL